MSIDKIIAKEMADSNSKTFPLKYGINYYIEWLKWLEYIPEFENIRRQELESKKIDELSLEELNELKKYLKQLQMLELFKLYGTNNISKEDYMRIYNYMKDCSIEDLMLSKLSKDELLYAKEKIGSLKELSTLELKENILDKNKENFEKLSMVDAYIFHMASKIFYARKNMENDTILAAQLRYNRVNSLKRMSDI